MATYGYLRVSTDMQELDNQRLSILEYCNKNNINVDEFIGSQTSSRLSTKDRGLDDLFGKMQKGDLLIVSELSRLGRSLGQIIRLVDEMISKGVKFVCIKENITLDGKQDIQTKVMVTMFGLFAEIERDLISERTKQGLVAARAKGKTLGRPKGAKGKSVLDGKEETIREYLELKVSKESIARILRVPRSTLRTFIASRELVG